MPRHGTKTVGGEIAAMGDDLTGVRTRRRARLAGLGPRTGLEMGDAAMATPHRRPEPFELLAGNPAGERWTPLADGAV